MCLTIFNSVGFGTRFITVNGQQIKLQIWDTVKYINTLYIKRGSNVNDRLDKNHLDQLLEVIIEVLLVLY